MRVIRTAFVAVISVGLVAAGVVRGQPANPVSWDSRIELVSLMFHLAGAAEYSTNKVPKYSEAVAAHFGALKEHPAVVATRDLHRNFRVAYFHPMNLAVHLGEPPGLSERVPFDQPGLAIGARLLASPYRPYLDHLRSFYRDARVAEFFKAQAPLYEVATNRLTKVVSAEIDEAWFRNYFGSGPSMRFRAVPSLLNGGAQYGATYRTSDVAEAYAVMGVFKIDAEGLPVFDRDDADNVVHEYAHTLTNAYVDAALPALESAGPKLFEKVRNEMRAQSYGTWQTMVYEQVVRAVVVRSIAARRGDAEALKEIEAQEKLGFTLTRTIVAVLADYERSRSTYPKFADIMPKVIEVFQSTSVPG
jgi:hypothetical protein